MKILHIASGDKWAGAEVQVWTLCTELVKQGHTVHAVILNPGLLAEALMSAGVTVTVFDENKFGFRRLLDKIKLELHRWQPDVVHTHRQKENILGALANRMTVRVPSFRTVHGAPEFAPNFRQRLQVALDRFSGKRLQDGIISVSDDLTGKLKHLYPRDKLFTIANGIDAQAVQAQANAQMVLNVDKRSYHVGFVGRLEPVKRLDLFVQMARHIYTNKLLDKPVHYHVFGDGSQREAQQKWVQEHDLDAVFTFHGHTDQIRGWIKQMDSLVMPSDHEGLPMTALESLALNVPMVTHAVGGLVPLLNAAECDGLVSEHTAEGYAQKLVELVSQRPQVSLPEAYSAQENARQIVELYQAMQAR